MSKYDKAYVSLYAFSAILQAWLLGRGIAHWISHTEVVSHWWLLTNLLACVVMACLAAQRLLTYRRENV